MEGHNNSYLNTRLIRAVGQEMGLIETSFAEVSIDGDPNYESVLVWSYEKA